MNLDKDARVLEVGSGFGPLTHHLASMGHNITCVDMDASLLEYVRERTRGLPGQVDTVLADMNTFTLDDSFDAILFFESFHHCADHIGLLKRLSRMLEPGGQLVLAGEPIVPWIGRRAVSMGHPHGRTQPVVDPQAWVAGTRLPEMYLRTLLEDTGWNVTASTAPTESVMGVWLCRAENDRRARRRRGSNPWRNGRPRDLPCPPRPVAAAAPPSSRRGRRGISSTARTCRWNRACTR